MDTFGGTETGAFKWGGAAVIHCRWGEANGDPATSQPPSLATNFVKKR